MVAPVLCRVWCCVCVHPCGCVRACVAGSPRVSVCAVMCRLCAGRLWLAVDFCVAHRHVNCPTLPMQSLVNLDDLCEVAG